MTVPSPCVKNCKIEKRSCQKTTKPSKLTGVCQGCRRTLDEIAGWSKFTDNQKQAVLDQIAMNPCRWTPDQPSGSIPILKS